MMSTRRALGTLCLVLGASCASQKRPAAYCAEPMIVSYPPPPAQVELLGPEREAPCTWIDGSFEWVGRRWQWKPGAWVIPPPGCVRAAPVTIWLPSEGRGVLYYRPASFCPSASGPKRAPNFRCAAAKPCARPPFDAKAPSTTTP